VVNLKDDEVKVDTGRRRRVECESERLRSRKLTLGSRPGRGAAELKRRTESRVK